VLQTFGRWGIFAGGTLALCFSNGVNGNVLAAWLAPALLLVFVMTTRPWAGLGAMILAGALGNAVMFHGALPMADTEFAVFCLVTGLIGAVPYVMSRLAAPRLGVVSGSLVFPCLMTGLGFVSTETSPFGSWAHDAYMQLDVAPLAQVAAFVGLWGVAFPVYFSASVAAAVVTQWGRGAVMALVLLASVTGGAFLAGTWRLQAPTVAGPMLRVAAFGNPAGMPDRFFEGCAARADTACRRSKAHERLDRLMAMTEESVRGGAKLVVWYEAAIQYDQAEEVAIVARVGEYAKSRGIYLVSGAAAIPGDPEALMINKAQVYTPQGTLAFEYLKAMPVPGEPIVKGDGVIRMLDTPHGRLGVMICFDADFPALARQAAAKGVDLLAIPANDWRAITPLHGHMTRFRAIENGFPVVRSTSNGLSIIADPRGSVLAAVNSFDQPGVPALADVPTSRIGTPYAVVGDSFAIASIITGLALLVLAAVSAIRDTIRTRSAGAAIGSHR
jgi:apolipoprotein N-acyltransferase